MSLTKLSAKFRETDLSILPGLTPVYAPVEWCDWYNGHLSFIGAIKEEVDNQWIFIPKYSEVWHDTDENLTVTIPASRFTESESVSSLSNM